MDDFLKNTMSAMVKQALSEDIGEGDLTAKLLSSTYSSTAEVVSNQKAILCGVDWFNETYKQLDPNVKITWHVVDGNSVSQGQVLCEITGPTSSILTGERTALNFLQTLSGTSTMTQRYVNALNNTKAQLLDTRKTIPGWRLAQKYAVRCGGGSNHRMGLYDAILIKENHIRVLGSIADSVAHARTIANDCMIEIEVESMSELHSAIQAKPDVILLDNFSEEMLTQAVAITAGRVKLEASGGINITNLSRIAATGVDYISVGSITKHMTAIDLSMRVL